MAPLRSIGCGPIAVLSLIALGAGAAFAQGTSTVPVEGVTAQSAIYQSRGKDVPSGYVIDRSLEAYADALAFDFRAALTALGPNDRWLDIGAGEGRAILDYCQAMPTAHAANRSEQGVRRAHAVALSIEDRRTEDWHKTAASLDAGRIKYHYGKPMRDYSRAELGRFQLITDVVGGFSYTDNLTAFMRTTLGALVTNGSFYTLLADVHAESGVNKPHYPDAPFLTEIKTQHGADLTVCAWLKSITCVEVTCAFRDDYVPPIEVYRIRKTCENVIVPALTTVHYTAGTPPERRFSMRATEAQRAE